MIYPHWHMTVYTQGQFSREQVYYGETLDVSPKQSGAERWYVACVDENCWFSKHPKESN